MIPNCFHFVYGLKPRPQRLHLIHYLALASCLDVNKPDAVYFYYHREPYGRYWDLIQERITPVPVPPVEFVRAYDYPDRTMRPYRYAHASDFVRLEKLIAHGGVYADIDTIFVNPLPDALRQHPFVLGHEEPLPDPGTGVLRPSLCNAFIMAERNAAFGNLWLERLPDAFDGTWSHHSTLLPYDLALEHPSWIHCEPSRTFFKHAWTRQGIHALLEGLDTNNQGVVSFHLWAHMWWSRFRRDFSSVHAAQFTEKFIKEVDTTYNVVARKHLPPPETRSFVVSKVDGFTRHLTPLKDATRRVTNDSYVLTKLAAFSIINHTPRAAEHLDYAWRQWKHPYIRTRFRARTPFEKKVIDDVALWDPYGVESLSFAPGDTVLDIGAHVGSFTYLCYRQGARSILAFEPDAQNFRSLAQHVGHLSGVALYNLGVFRSDACAPSKLLFSGPLDENTAGGNLVLGGALVEATNQQVCRSVSAPQTVGVIPLDEILERVGRVKLCKLDCEASEFPILLTSRCLDRIERIVGEYHEITPAVFERLDPAAKLNGFDQYRAQDLVACLEAAGFCVSHKPIAPHLGMFTAARAIPSVPA